MALNVCSYTLGFTKQLSSMLQGTAMDVIEAYKQIELVKTQLNSLQGNCDEVFISDIWPKVKELAHIADIELSTPRQCRRQTKRTNVPSVTTDEYFKWAVFIPVIDHLMAELEFQFSCIQVNVTQGMYLIPENLSKMSNIERDQISNFFDWVLPSPATFNQEIELWKTKWKAEGILIPNSLSQTLDVCNYKLFPNVYTCLHVLSVMPVSTAAVERSHSSLKIVKSKLQSRMGEGRLNALMLLYVHKDIELDYNKIIDRYAKKYPRRMRFSNPLQDK